MSSETDPNIKELYQKYGGDVGEYGVSFAINIPNLETIPQIIIRVTTMGGRYLLTGSVIKADHTIVGPLKKGKSGGVGHSADMIVKVFAEFLSELKNIAGME